MPTYAVDSKRQRMTTTGIVQPVTEWEGPKGSRRPTDRQAHDEHTGMPLWLVEVMYLLVMFGQQLTTTSMVRVPNATRPEIQPLTPIEFDGLRCDVFVKAGGFEERWSADAISTAAKPGRQSGGAG